MAYSQARRPSKVRIPFVANVAIGTNAIFGTLIAPFPGELLSSQLENGASISVNATDFNIFSVQKSVNSNMASNVQMASHNCGATALTANVPVNMTLNTTIASCRVNAGDYIQVWKNATLNGTAGTANITGGATLFFIWDQYDHTSG